jgi:hypothetical protein
MRGQIKDCRRVASMIGRYRRRVGNDAGGSLHIVVDDTNIDDGSVQFCIDYAEQARDWTGARLGRLLALCSRTQRAKIVDRVWRAPKE